VPSQSNKAEKEKRKGKRKKKEKHKHWGGRNTGLGWDSVLLERLDVRWLVEVVLVLALALALALGGTKLSETSSDPFFFDLERPIVNLPFFSLSSLLASFPCGPPR